MKSQSISATLLLALLAVPAGAQRSEDAPPEGYARARAVDVDAAGWVATRLEVAAAAHVGVDLTVLAPDGRRLKVYRLDERAGRRGVQVTSLEPGREGDRAGRWVHLDLGADPPRHFRLEFVAEERVEAPDCVLQASADGRRWTELGRGGLFRLGDDAALQRLALDYPTTSARFLRLFWPDTAGTPALERVSVLAEGDAVESMDVAADCTVLENRRTCRLQLTGVPARQVRRLDLMLQSAGSAHDEFGWRLWSAQNGSWRLVSEGVRTTAEDGESVRVVRVSLDDGERWKLLADAHDPVLRVELWGGDSAPVVVSARLWAARSAVAFKARGAGRHVIAWGGARAVGAFSDGAPEDDESQGRMAWFEAGETRTGTWPVLDPRLVAPGKEFEATGYSSAWPVEFDAGVQPGELIHLALDRSVRTDSHWMRLSFDGRLLPFVELDVDEPRLAGSMRLRPAAAAGEPRSRAEVRGLGDGEAAYSQLVVHAPGPFERQLSLSRTVPGRRGRPPSRQFLLHEISWSCRHGGPLPCVHDQNATIGGFGEPDVELLVNDGDDLPLPWLDLELWRPRAAILFVAPEGVSDGVPVTLHLADPELGDPRPGPPRFDLGSVSRLLRLRPFTAARLGTFEVVDKPSPIPVSWLLYGALALAVLVLLALLGRMLREPSGA